MPEALVLDASAALAVLRDEPLSAAVVAVLVRHKRAGGAVSVPGHFWLEIANVLVRRYGHSPAEVLDVVQGLDQFQIETVDLDRPLWLLTVARSSRLRLTAYDAAFLALAESLNADLLTTDRELAAAAGSRAVSLGPRLAETSVRYGADEPDDELARFGSYLGALRQEIAAT